MLPSTSVRETTFPVDPQVIEHAGALPIARRAVISSTWARRDMLTRRALLVSDVIAIELALLLAGLASDSSFRPQFAELALLALPVLPVWALLFKLYGLYDRDLKRISHGSIDDLPWLFHALIIGTLGMWFYLRALPDQRLLFVEAAVFGCAALILLVVGRSTVRSLILARLGNERVLIAGDAPACELLVRKMATHPEYGLKPVLLLHANQAEADQSEALVGASNGGHAKVPSEIGGAEELRAIVNAGKTDRVLISRDDYSSDEVLRMIDICRRHSIKVGVVPAAADAFGPSLELDEVEGVTVLGVNPPVLGRTSRMVKRGFDLTIAAPVLLLFSLPMLAIAAAIKINSPRDPVFFSQERVGKEGRVFRLHKFRTMVRDAEEQRAALMEHSVDPRWLHIPNDPRVTKVGAFLRRMSLDELPQLFNVIKGDMSLVGPRPLPRDEDAMVAGWARGRLELTPGITGLWQVLGRTSIPFEEMVKLDYSYVANWNIWMDTRLLLRTLPAVIRGRGAN